MAVNSAVRSLGKIYLNQNNFPTIGNFLKIFLPALLRHQEVFFRAVVATCTLYVQQVRLVADLGLSAV